MFRLRNVRVKNRARPWQAESRSRPRAATFPGGHTEIFLSLDVTDAPGPAVVIHDPSNLARACRTPPKMAFVSKVGGSPSRDTVAAQKVPVRIYRHQIPSGYKVRSTTILGGHHYEYWLGKVA